MISSASLPELTDDVAVRTMERLQSLLLRDADFEDQQSEFEAVAAKFRRARRRLRKRIFDIKSTVAPVRRLPLEMLTHVFGFLITSSQKDLAHVSLVCKRWNTVSLAPRLWTNLVISAENTREASKARFSLKQASKLDLSVTYLQSTPPDKIWIWNTIIQSSGRWRDLSLTVDDCTVASAFIRTLVDAHRLRELSVKIMFQCRKPADEGKLGFQRDINDDDASTLVQNCPLLRTLRLETFVLPSPGSLFNVLTTLHIIDAFARLQKPTGTLQRIRGPELLNLLLECHNLEDFTFHGAESYHSFFSDNMVAIRGPVVVLPRLRRLHLDCHYGVGHSVLMNLTAESLETAVLKMRPRHDGHNVSHVRTLVSFFNRSQKLRSLRLYGFPTCFVIQGAARGFRHLEELHLEYLPNLDEVIEWYASPRRERNVGPLWYAPRLCRLTIEAQPYGVPFKGLGMLVRRRFDANAAGLGPSRIERLVVNEQDMLKGAAPGELAAFERPQRFGGRKIVWAPTSP